MKILDLLPDISNRSLEKYDDHACLDNVFWPCIDHGDYESLFLDNLEHRDKESLRVCI